MAGRGTNRETEPTLRPVRWPTTGPRRAVLLRAALVAVLLVLAAGALYARGAPPCRPLPAGTGPTVAPATAGPSTRTPGLPAGSVGVPVRLAEPAALAVVRPGNRVDLLAVPPSATGEPLLMAPRALVLDVLERPGIPGVDGDTAALYLALEPGQAGRVISLPEGSRLAIVVRG